MFLFRPLYTLYQQLEKNQCPPAQPPADPGRTEQNLLLPMSAAPSLYPAKKETMLRLSQLKAVCNQTLLTGKIFLLSPSFSSIFLDEYRMKNKRHLQLGDQE
jgi:hypothetical protein